MKLIKQERVRGSVIRFDFSHRSTKLGTIVLSATAINEKNAKSKAMDELKRKYADRKAWNKQYNATRNEIVRAF